MKDLEKVLEELKDLRDEAQDMRAHAANYQFRVGRVIAEVDKIIRGDVEPEYETIEEFPYGDDLVRLRRIMSRQDPREAFDIEPAINGRFRVLAKEFDHENPATPIRDCGHLERVDGIFRYDGTHPDAHKALEIFYDKK